VRNVSFKSKEQTLMEEFSKWGTVQEIVLPRKPNGHLKGFAFVQFQNHEAASLAVHNLNAKEIAGRMVAVDWALSKDKYEEFVSINSRSNEEHISTDEKKPNEDSEDDSEEDNEKDNEEDDKDSEGDDEKDNEEDNEDNEEDEKEQDDVNDGATLFIRNLSLDTERLALKKKFGRVKGVYIVRDHQTGKSRGSAFVQFENKSITEEVLQQTYSHIDYEFDVESHNLETNIILDGKSLIITRAVNKQKAQQFKQTSNTKEKIDKRNLYLAKEGVIMRNSPAAEGLAQSDITKRERSYKEKKRN